MHGCERYRSLSFSRFRTFLVLILSEKFPGEAFIIWYYRNSAIVESLYGIIESIKICHCQTNSSTCI